MFCNFIDLYPLPLFTIPQYLRYIHSKVCVISTRMSPLLEHMEKVLRDLPRENVTQEHVRTAKQCMQKLQNKKQALVKAKLILRKSSNGGDDVSDMLDLCNRNGLKAFELIEALRKYIKEHKKKATKPDHKKAVVKPADKDAGAPAQDAPLTATEIVWKKTQHWLMLNPGCAATAAVGGGEGEEDEDDDDGNSEGESEGGASNDPLYNCRGDEQPPAAGGAREGTPHTDIYDLYV